MARKTVGVPASWPREVLVGGARLQWCILKILAMPMASVLSSVMLFACRYDGMACVSASNGFRFCATNIVCGAVVLSPSSSGAGWLFPMDVGLIFQCLLSLSVCLSELFFFRLRRALGAVHTV